MMLTDEEIEKVAKPFLSNIGDHWCNEEGIRNNGTVEDFARAVIEANNAKVRILYTSPQPREWQDLSEKEIEKICSTGAVYAPNGLVIRRTIEYRGEIKAARLAGVRQASAALRAKNGVKV